MSNPFDSHPNKVGTVLWTIQALLAALFLFAGGIKLILPAAALTAQMHMPAPFLRFIGACELLGALGLVLPGLLHLHEELTPLAATGLIVIMIGAVIVSVPLMGVAAAVPPFVVGCLAAFIAYGRRRLADGPTRSIRRPQAVPAR